MEGMEKAIAIVDEMKKSVSKEIDDIKERYSKTSATNIYDAGYREILEHSFKTKINTFGILYDVLVRLREERDKMNDVEEDV